MNTVCYANQRHTITINHTTFVKLKSIGRFGESYSDVISRMLGYLENPNSNEEEKHHNT
jgi:predicted CopG family antitoxin